MLTGEELDDPNLPSGNVVIGGASVPWGDGLTQDQVTALCQQDCASREIALSSLVTVPLTQHQFDALFSLYFNIGGDHFHGSTVLHLLNQGDYAGAASHFTDWRFAGGKPILLPRRLREQALWNS